MYEEEWAREQGRLLGHIAGNMGLDRTSPEQYLETFVMVGVITREVFEWLDKEDIDWSADRFRETTAESAVGSAVVASFHDEFERMMAEHRAPSSERPLFEPEMHEDLLEQLRTLERTGLVEQLRSLERTGEPAQPGAPGIHIVRDQGRVTRWLVNHFVVVFENGFAILSDDGKVYFDGTRGESKKQLLALLEGGHPQRVADHLRQGVTASDEG
jgi:hypothetical protein